MDKVDRLLFELRDLSSRMAGRLEEATLEELLEFVDQRERCIEQLKQLETESHSGFSETSAERRIALQAISQYDEAIVSRMHQMQQDVTQGLNKLDQSRMQRSAYEIAYTMESAFIDQKK